MQIPNSRKGSQARIINEIKKHIDKLDLFNISLVSKSDDARNLVFKIKGQDDSVYSGGEFRVQFVLGSNYPFQPPFAKFLTKIYHPNIDSEGRICMDLLKSPPHGSWKPSNNIVGLLLSIQVLMDNPNPEDGLNLEASKLYKDFYAEYERRAREHTRVISSAGGS